MIKKTSAIALFLFHISIANGSTITFDPPPCLTCNSQLTSYEESGVLFSGNVSHHNTNISGSAVNESSGSIRFAFMGSMTLERTDGSPFSLIDVELAEYSSSFMGAQRTILFEGTRSDTSIVTQSFTIDGIMDGAGGIDDFELFAFSSGFTDLLHVDVSGEMVSLDNITVSSIPIPAAFWLFMSGLIGLVCTARRKIQLG